MGISEIRRKFEQEKGKRDALVSSIKSKENSVQSLKNRLRIAEEGQTIIQHVAKKTQDTLEYKISSIVSLALESIMDDPYEFLLRFEPKRGKTECVPLFKRRGIEQDPMFASGFGAVDIAAYFWRIALQNLQYPRTCKTIISDEPFRDLKGDEMPERAGQAAKMISEKLGLQLIMTSHTREVISSADKVFKTTLVSGITKIEEVDNES